jgi:lipid-A-disaccharide synthase
MANLRIALVAGEASGDILGAGLMRALKAQHPAVEFIGVGGPLMQAEGLTSYFPMERLSVMGLVEVLGRLRELLARRKLLIQTLIEEKPDVFIGIDAPDFTLNIELKLRQAGIKTVHYVSPSVWAWRQKRVLKIREGCDLMLTLLPFEARFYEEKGVPVRFVGHTLADTIPLQADRAAARAELGLPDGPLVALMPGSRGGEVGRLASVFFDAAERLQSMKPGIRFVLPCASPQRRAQIETLLEGRNLPLTLLDGKSHLALAACDAVLIASGTATLEALLYKRPMVVAYRLAPLTFWILKRMVKSPYISLPNLLAQRLLVPELLQDDATPEALAQDCPGRRRTDRR